MRCCKNAPDRRRWSRLFALCAGLFLAVAAHAESGIAVRRAESRIVNDIYVVDADLTMTLSDEVRTALDSGVPLTFIVEIEFREPRRYLWDPTVATSTLQLRLEYHALSKRYVTSNLSARTRDGYPTLDDALVALGTLRGVAIGERRFLAAENPGEGRIRAMLDTEALPAPLRPVAYLTSAWRLKSKWARWTITP
jgi:hypothetical protein